MKVHHLLATFALVLSAAACVDAPPEESEPVATEPALAGPAPFCQPTVWAQALLPQISQYSYALPPDQGGSKQVWVMVPTNAQYTSYDFYQVNLGTLKVSWRTQITEQQRPYAMYLAALRPGTQVAIRNPPPPPWPPATEWAYADAVVNLAVHVVGSHY